MLFEFEIQSILNTTSTETTTCTEPTAYSATTTPTAPTTSTAPTTPTASTTYTAPTTPTASTSPTAPTTSRAPTTPKVPTTPPPRPKWLHFPQFILLTYQKLSNLALKLWTINDVKRFWVFTILVSAQIGDEPLAQTTEV